MKLFFALALLVGLVASLSLNSAHDRRYWKAGCNCPKRHYDPLENWFTLEFDHASRNGVSQTSNTFKVTWNGATVKHYSNIRNYNVNHAKHEVKATHGKNSLHFIATGISDGLGQQISNVKLYRNSFCGYEDLAVNGAFREGHSLGHGWSIWRKDQFKGWKCNDEIEVGWGKIYNPRWPANTYVSELDTNHNSDIYQEFYLDKYYRVDDPES